MIRFVLRRLFEAIPVLFVIITATFFLQRFIPGGPFTAEKAVSAEVQKNLDRYYHLDDPLWKQYVDYLWDLCPKTFHPSGLAHGLDLKAAFGIDLRPSFKYPNRTVNEIIADKLPTSLELGGWSLLVALVVGLPLGVLAAVKRNTWIDYLCSSTAMIGICVPTFVMGPLLILVFAIHFRAVNASGWYDPIDRVLPSIVLGFFYSAYIARLTRGGMLDTLNQDFIRTARAKGASEIRIVFKHALRGGLQPVVSFLGPAVAGILTGSFVIETIFQIPGLGREFVNSAFSRDYTLVLGTVILYATLVVGLNLVVDIVQVWLNPKLKFE
jgi:oligopeptide transport system permease protein